MKDSVQHLVYADLIKRGLDGWDKYGKAVDPDDSSEDWLQHAYEESLDLCVYLKAELLRRRATK